MALPDQSLLIIFCQSVSRSGTGSRSLLTPFGSATVTVVVSSNVRHGPAAGSNLRSCAKAKSAAPGIKPAYNNWRQVIPEFIGVSP